ncbi:MAG: S8 family serine peptidase [Caldisericia bacterium]|nr:S8 family serine peptidase [Caldisericia bacterium]
MKKQTIIVMVLSVLVFLSGLFPSKAKGNTEKISSSFYMDICSKTQLIPVVIEFNKPCSYRYIRDTFQLSSFVYTQEEILKKYESSLSSYQNQLLQKWQNQGIGVYADQQIYHVMNAIIGDIRGVDIDQLLNNPGVKYVYDNRIEYTPERTIAAYTTQVEQLRETFQYTGEGIRVGILDSGLDRTHQDFSSDLADANIMDANEYVKQSRVYIGEDFADGDSDWHDDLPVGMHGHGHGTHVAGIVGGNSWIHDDSMGMAPQVEFCIYKVFTKEKSGARNILAAIDKAFTDQCDIINMSLGHSGGSAIGSSYYTSLTENIKEAIESGAFFVVASAGNDGTRGRKLNFSTGSPASTYDFFSVAASNDRPFETFLVSLEGIERSIDFTLSPHSGPFTNQILKQSMIPCGLGKKEDIPQDVHGNIALIERGGMTFREKMDNAKEKGAIAVILYNHSAGLITPALVTGNENPDDIETIPVCMVSKIDGHWLLDHREEPLEMTLKEGRQMTIATFSSSGPTVDGFFKPEITAPGTAILSCFPPNSYAKAGGTSMSAPVVTGLSALLKEVHPEWNLMQIKSAFMNTAEILVNPLTNHPIALSMQGAGEARLENALDTPAFIEPQACIVQPSIVQPHGITGDEPIQFTVTSNSEEPITFRLSTEIFSLLPDEHIPFEYELEKEFMTLKPGEKGTFSIAFSLEADSPQRDHYDGLIWLETETEEQNLHIPFILYPEGILTIDAPISNVLIEPKQWDYSSECIDPLKMGFYLHSGTEQSIEGETNYNNFANVMVSLVDESGQEWALIDTPSSLLAGDYYYFEWSGKTKNGGLVLFDGDYYLKITIDGFVYKNGELIREISYNSMDKDKENVRFEIANSPVPLPENIIISANRLYNADEPIHMGFILEKAKDINGVCFTYRYDPQALDFEGVSYGKDIRLHDTDQFVVDHDIDHGILQCLIVQEDENWTGDFFHILSFQFRLKESGKPLLFDFKDGFIFESGQESGRLKAFYPEVKGTRRTSYLLCDLNDDRVVDKYDFMEFQKYFDSSYGDEKYNAICDFNQDHRIQVEDLMILGSEYEDK